MHKFYQQATPNLSTYLKVSTAGVYLGFFKWGGTPKSKWGGTAPPLCGGALAKSPPQAPIFLQKSGEAVGGHKKSGEAVGGHPKIQSGGALFKKAQKWGGTRPSAPPLPGLKYTPAYY